MRSMKNVLSALVLIFLGASASLHAQESSGRKELQRADLSGAPGMEVILSITELKPGDVLPEHFHHGIEAGYIVEGGIMQQAGKAPVTFADGASLMNLRDIMHGGYKVVGTRTIKLITVHVVDKGKPLYDTAKK